MEHKLPSMQYEFNVLEPFIDEETMKIHYTKHHQGYVDKLNLALKDHKEYQDFIPEKLIKNINKIPAKIRTVVRNNAGGHFNHSFFWPTLKKGTIPQGEILKVICENFGTFENFKKEFSSSALSLFGSGWTWLVLNKKDLEIVNTSNQDNPLSEGLVPILGIDVWEHAYYLKYQNRRAEYIEAFFNVINWDKINDIYVNSLKK
jgi:Fe-Mn family superoxide dismutase